MFISNEQKRTLSTVLFITGLLSWFYYGIAVIFAFFFYFLGSWNFGLLFLGFILPYCLFLVGYGTQFTTIFLKKNKKRFVLSIVSYSGLILLFITLIIFYIITAPELGLYKVSENIGIVPISFMHLLFLLNIVFNFSLVIFLTHVKVKDEEKMENVNEKSIIKTKLGKTYLTVAIVAFAFIALYLAPFYFEMLYLFNDKFRDYQIKGHPIKGVGEIFSSFVLLFFVVLVIGISLQIVSMVDVNKRKLGLTGIVCELIGTIAILCYFLYYFTAGINMKDSFEIIFIVFSVLTILASIANTTMFFVSRKLNKQTEVNLIIQE